MSDSTNVDQYGKVRQVVTPATDPTGAAALDNAFSGPHSRRVPNAELHAFIQEITPGITIHNIITIMHNIGITLKKGHK